GRDVTTDDDTGPRECDPNTWTVETVVGEPPPYTKVSVPRRAAEASWTASGRWTLEAPPDPFVVKALIVDPAAPGASSPPSTVKPPVDGTTASRDTAAGSCQGSTPASIDAMVRAVPRPGAAPLTRTAANHTTNASTRSAATPATNRRRRYTRRRAASARARCEVPDDARGRGGEVVMGRGLRQGIGSSCRLVRRTPPAPGRGPAPRPAAAACPCSRRGGRRGARGLG